MTAPKKLSACPTRHVEVRRNHASSDDAFHFTAPGHGGALPAASAHLALLARAGVEGAFDSPTIPAMVGRGVFLLASGAICVGFWLKLLLIVAT